MNIDDLTIGQAKDIAKAFGAKAASSRVEGDLRPVIVRCRDAGVHYGLLEAYDGRTVWLQQSRRLWRWHAVDGIALSGVAQHGIIPDKSKVDTLVPKIVLLDACEIIDASPASAQTILKA